MVVQRGSVMQPYEIRVVHDGDPVRIYPSLQINDYAAIRRARRIAAEQDKIEVWRGEVCVFAQTGERRADF